MSELNWAVSPPGSSNRRDYLFDLATTYLTSRSQKRFDEPLSKETLSDLIARARLGDLEGIVAEFHLSTRDAVTFARNVSSLVQDRDDDWRSSAMSTPTRQLLRTPDARKLARELLAIFAKEASSKFAANRILFLLSPTLDKRELGKRLNLCVKGRDIFNDLQLEGRLKETKGLLEPLEFSKESSSSRKSNKLTSKEWEVIRYFTARRKMLETVHVLLTDFSQIKSLVSFLVLPEEEVGTPSAISTSNAHNKTKNTLAEILKILEEVGRLGLPDAEGIVSDGEIAVNDELRLSKRSMGSFNREGVKRLIENQISQISSTLGMNRDEEDDLIKAVFEGLTSSSSSSSVEFDRRRVKGVLDEWRQRRTQDIEKKLEKVETSLRGFIEETDELIERLVMLDQVLALASIMQKYSLVIPRILERKGNGIAFKKGLNMFLLKESKQEEAEELQRNRSKVNAARRTSNVQPVSYSIGVPTTEEGAESSSTLQNRNVVMLTGANSGGKTTLLTTLASIHILSLYGLPVPCESAEVSPMPVYLFRRRMTKKIGSLEQALRSFIPVFASSGRSESSRSLVLIDEFEALTEPGAAGRIIATMMNKAVLGSNLVLLVTHLAREALPHIKLPVRVDGIEASGFDQKTGELLVDRQPKFNHIGSSSPQYIVTKLSRQSSGKANVRALYSELLEALGSDSDVPVQTPILLPWT